MLNMHLLAVQGVARANEPPTIDDPDHADETVIAEVERYLPEPEVTLEGDGLELWEESKKRRQPEDDPAADIEPDEGSHEADEFDR